jgi:hypothetical protein
LIGDVSEVDSLTPEACKPVLRLMVAEAGRLHRMIDGYAEVVQRRKNEVAIAQHELQRMRCFLADKEKMLATATNISERMRFDASDHQIILSLARKEALRWRDTCHAEGVKHDVAKRRLEDQVQRLQQTLADERVVSQSRKRPMVDASVQVEEDESGYGTSDSDSPVWVPISPRTRSLRSRLIKEQIKYRTLVEILSRQGVEAAERFISNMEELERP